MSDRIRGKAAGLVVLLIIIAPRLVAAQTAGRPIMVHIDSVLAADTNQGFDTRLAPMSHRLKKLFHYSTYRLESHQEAITECGRITGFSLPGGLILHVEPRRIEGEMIEMGVSLFQGERPMMATDFHLMNSGVLMLGGPRYEQGTLIISIAAEAMPPHLVSPLGSPNASPLPPHSAPNDLR